MNFTISINQIQLVENFPAVKIKEAAVLDWCKRISSNANVPKKVENNLLYFRISYQKIIDDMPLLEITNPRVMARKVSTLVESGILTRHETNAMTNQVWVAFTAKSEIIWTKSVPQQRASTPTPKSTPPIHQEVHPHTPNSTGPMHPIVQDPCTEQYRTHTLDSVTYPNTNPNTNPISNQDSARAENSGLKNSKTLKASATKTVATFFQNNDWKYYAESWGCAGITKKQFWEEIKDWIAYHENEIYFLQNIGDRITGGASSLRGWLRKDWKLEKYKSAQLKEAYLPAGKATYTAPTKTWKGF